LFRGDLMAFDPEVVEGLTHEMHGADRVLKPGVQCSRIDIVGQSELFDPSQPLEISVFNQVEDQIGRYGDKPIYRIIEDLALIHTGMTCSFVDEYIYALINGQKSGGRE